ncbi:hypothetical protein S7711_11342 [Stachybotrys chartarum IBT 7711]|uniref:Uncharacterized protein n=1 Tax=Stachybotrys chartarum (strain CBS 109288 / IBT 7711) TaxID=1280523 RepID=A0A084AX73_STACB|nr:hypothetical protein S7711_11342 [Stachybotrys chartarum IBT 7711]
MHLSSSASFVLGVFLQRRPADVRPFAICPSPLDRADDDGGTETPRLGARHWSHEAPDLVQAPRRAMPNPHLIFGCTVNIVPGNGCRIAKEVGDESINRIVHNTLENEEELIFSVSGHLQGQDQEYSLVPLLAHILVLGQRCGQSVGAMKGSRRCWVEQCRTPYLCPKPTWKPSPWALDEFPSDVATVDGPPGLSGPVRQLSFLHANDSSPQRIAGRGGSCFPSHNVVGVSADITRICSYSANRIFHDVVAEIIDLVKMLCEEPRLQAARSR